MELCENNHDEICFKARYCPLCELREEMQSNIDDITNDLETSSAKIEELSDDLYTMKTEAKNG